PLDGRHRAAGVRDPPSRRSRGAGARHGADVDAGEDVPVRLELASQDVRTSHGRRTVGRGADDATEPRVLPRPRRLRTRPPGEPVRETIAACPKDASQEAVTALVGLDMTEELPKIRVPALVLSGSADVIAPPAQGRRIAELIPDARLEVFRGAGHMLMLERT